MMLSKGYKLLLVVLIAMSSMSSKLYTTKNSKAVALFSKGVYNLTNKDYEKATANFKDCIKIDNNFIEAYIELAKIKILINNDKDAIAILNKNVYKQLIKQANAQYINLYLEIANLYYSLGQYKKTKKYVDVINNIKYPKELTSKINILNKDIAFALKKVKYPIKFTPKKLPPPLNGFASQSFPILTIDEQTIIFTGKKQHDFYSKEDIYISYKNIDGQWSTPNYLSDKINTNGNEGSCTISSDGKILILASCNRKDNYGKCDLYISYKQGNEWSAPKNLGPNINGNIWQSHPSLSSDNKTLYFVAERVGNYGKKDIWKSRLLENGEWSAPENLGTQINSVGREIAPFIHPNGKTLFFSSDRKPSLGRFDLYYSNYINGEWTNPVSLPYPINNHKDQIAIFITASGEKGYYSYASQKNNEYYTSYLYEFDIPDQILDITSTNYAKLDITNKYDNIPLAANIEVYNLIGNKLIINDKIQDCSIIKVFQENDKYYVNIQQDGYIYESIILNNQENINTKIYLKRIKEGEIKVLNNILFDFDEYIPKHDSIHEINFFVNFLKKNPNLKIEIQGYTDEHGSNEYNKKLSTMRAKTIYNIITKAGINKSNITYKGYGKDFPISNDDSANRRVAFKIIKLI